MLMRLAQMEVLPPMNESFNLVVASEAPKIHHYSKSESLDFRFASAVCQKNIDQTYMTDVNTAIGLSPGKISHKFSSQQEKVKLRKKSSSVQFKKRSLAESKQKDFT